MSHRSIAIGALLVGVAMAALFVAGSWDTPLDSAPLPPEKASASADPFDYAALSEPARQPEDARPDQGDPAAVRQVRQAVVPLLDAHQNSMAMPTDIVARRQSFASRQTSLRRTISRTWSPEQSSSKTDELIGYLRDVISDRSYRAYAKSRFEVDEWQGISVSGDQALVMFTGHTEFFIRGEGWHAGTIAQHKIRLIRQQLTKASHDPGWQLETHSTLILDGQG